MPLDWLKDNRKPPQGGSGTSYPGSTEQEVGISAERLRLAVVTSVTPQEVRNVVRKLVEQAQDGDVQAAEVLLKAVLINPLLQ